MTTRFWFDLPTTRRLADHAASCTIFTASGAAGAEACLLVDITHPGRLGSNGRSEHPAPAWLPATHVDGGPQPRDRHDRIVAVPLVDHDQPDTGLLYQLRLAGGACWFTVDLDADGTAWLAVRPVRVTREVPAGATWASAQVRAGGIGPYPAQVARGYLRSDGSVFARFTRDAAWWIALDLRSQHAAPRRGETIRVTGERVELVRHPGTGRQSIEPVPPDRDGWWRIGDTWPWTLADAEPATDGADARLCESWGPDGDQERCTVCHAVDQIDHQEMPSMVGYGRDTYSRCLRCGSHESTDPMFGAHPHPAPWPPPPDRQAELDAPGGDRAHRDRS